jgi:hypothetical protein
LVVDLKETDSSPNLDSDLEKNKRRKKVDAKPSATIGTTTIQPEEPEDPEEGEGGFFQSQMWVKGTPLHFIVDSISQKNLIKQLDLSTTPHPQSYNIEWLRQGQDLCVSQQCLMSYDIKLFKDEVLCDVSPLEVCDVMLDRANMWKRHVVYESQPCSDIVTLGSSLQYTRGSSDYCPAKTVPQSNISHCKVYPLHNPIRR